MSFNELRKSKLLRNLGSKEQHVVNLPTPKEMGFSTMVEA